MNELTSNEPVSAAELAPRCCNRKPFRLQYKATYENRRHYVCVDCGAEYVLKPDHESKPRLTDSESGVSS
jgi:hypothetical protein